MSKSVAVPSSPARAITRLEALRERFDDAAAMEKLALLHTLRRARVAHKRDVGRLHECLCFARAYPDSPALLALVEEMCAGFSARSDVRGFADELASSGMSGTPIHFRFYWPTARWMARCWPEKLVIDWDEVDDDSRLIHMLPFLLPFAETAALFELDLSGEEWLARLKGPKETDATFLVKRFEALEVIERVREQLFDDLNLPFTLRAGPTTPSRTRPHVTGFPTAFQTQPRRRHRPDMKAEMRRAPEAVRYVKAREADALIDLAREAMNTRARDLDAIAYAEPRDVSLIDDGDGVQFVGYGVQPERRFVLEAIYVFLVLNNGVPVGYMQGSGVFGWAEVNFNVFEPFRGAEAAHLYGRSLAVVHALLGTETFVVEPFQLGQGNDEAIATGAWWFYYKLGYRPKTRAAQKLVREEKARMAKNPKHRTRAATLLALADAPMFLTIGTKGTGSVPHGSVGRIGVAVSEHIAARYGADREAAVRDCMHDAADHLGVSRAALRKRPRDIVQAWERWAPLLSALDVGSWTAADREGLAHIVDAKGGARESAFLRLCDEHPRLQDALARLGRKPRR